MATPVAAADPEAARRDADRAGLVYVADTDPGIRRRRQGRGFCYRDAGGKVVRDRATLERIRALAIPPAWADVWICADPRGHLQATGRDARGRKQYRYHPEWALHRGQGKFERILAFGKALPALRRRIRRDLALPGYPREKVLAMVVALMDHTLLRVGNETYRQQNRSYGLTTLRNHHIRFLAGGRAHISFRGKAGQPQEAVVDDRRLARLVRRCRELPGQCLFQYRDDDGNVQPVQSNQVNDYLRETMGEAFTAKDFRTWGGTVAAMRALAALEAAASERECNALQVQVIREVASLLGNTPAVCRKAYIDPRVFDGWRDGSLQRHCSRCRGDRQWEQAALVLLRRTRRATA
ncbi:DNA topoisomerase IB [Pseudoxanthomonas sp. SGT-18]|uniref:DNA topoisomerase IB n=1 Tax=Pseudoxanthomonas sp. SGT-18 TaxID=2493087 RepID=UPI001F0CC866|nr:DNA topoisomerase IB [Pseudoxanthomonas sp. SGT-18]